MIAYNYRYLPLHHACSKDQASLEVIEMLIDAYPEGLLDFDYEDKLPLDRLYIVLLYTPANNNNNNNNNNKRTILSYN